jgi:hypothetical protein
MSFWSSLSGGPTAICKVVGRNKRKDAPAIAENIDNPMARSRNGVLFFFRIRKDESLAPFEPSNSDMLLPGHKYWKRLSIYSTLPRSGQI